MGFFASGCGAPRQSPHTVEPTVAPDSAMFALAVQRMREDFPQDTFFVDPSLLAGGPEALDPLEVLDTADAGRRSLIETRRRVLRSMGVQSRTIPDMDECPRATIEVGTKTRCPSYVATGIIAGVAREGGAYLPDGGYDERASGKANHERAMRVLRIVLSPHGSNLTAYDLVFREIGGTWRRIRSMVLYSE